jgi:enamine deaminase RidA (YjgF/YER057c/UK114 family)
MSAPIQRWLAPANPGTRYHSAVRHGELIFVSGQLGTTSGAELVDFASQLERALENLFAAVRALGGDRKTILKVNGYLAELADFTTYTLSMQRPSKAPIIRPGLPSRLPVSAHRFLWRSTLSRQLCDSAP